MTNKYTKLMLVIVGVIVLIAAAAGITFAVWSDTGSINATGTKVEVTNTTYKYLVFEIYDTSGNLCYVSYDDASATYVYAAQYQNEYKDGVIGTAFDIANVDHARVIGYANTNLGELESLVIPDNIDVTLGSAATTEQVAVTEIRMMSPEEFPALDLITEVTIPDSVESIMDGSFMGLENLTTVNFEGTKPANIGADCFTMCPKLTTVIR